MAQNQVRLDIERREPFAGGGAFGDTGPYERLLGKAHFAIDPDEQGLPYIVDLDLAPRNAQGLVEFAATLDIIKPVELGRGNRRLFSAAIHASTKSTSGRRSTTPSPIMLSPARLPGATRASGNGPTPTRWSFTCTLKGLLGTPRLAHAYGPTRRQRCRVPTNARMYHLTGAPHMVRAIDDPDWIGQLTPNAISAIPFRRAVLVLLDRWATHGTPPPASLLPRTADGTLVTAAAVLASYPKLQGVNLPKGLSRLPRYNYGPEFDSHGIMSVFPPEPFAGQEYPLRVPQIDADGNTIAGLRYPDIEVPLGTYNGWSLRKAGFAEGEQWWNTGSFVPFARTRAERQASGDPRPSVEERYPSHEAYIAAVTRVCEARVSESLMLQEDADRFIAAARQRNPLDPSVRLAPLIQAGAYTGR